MAQKVKSNKLNINLRNEINENKQKDRNKLYLL